jgi:sulfide:quinone oxidoreductase
MSPRSPDGNHDDAFRVVLAGGGVAALEAGLALRDLAGDGVELTLVTPSKHFVYRPMAVLEPFTGRPPRRLPMEKVAAKLKAALEPDSVSAVDPDARVVHTQGGRELGYDALLLAIGAQIGDVPPGAIAIDPSRMADSLEGMIGEIDHGELETLAFAVPQRAWPLPAYELALLSAERAREHDVELQITIATAEPRPLDMFGEAISDAVADLLSECGIEVLTDVPVLDQQLDQDRVVAVPALAGPAISGVPADVHGFLPVTPFAQVAGVERVYAAGDATSFPVKWGGIAAQQADAAAASIAALAGAPAEPAPFDGVVHGVLLGDRKGRRLYFSARIQDGRTEYSQTSSEPTWTPDAKISATYLGPYLDELWAQGPRWLASQLSWESVLKRLEDRFADTDEVTSTARGQ